MSKAVAYAIRPRFEVNPPWQVKKVQHFKLYDPLFQQHIRTIQLWLHSSGSENISVFVSQRKTHTCKQHFCQSLLIELLNRDQSQRIRNVLDSLRNDSKLEFAEALSYVIMIALEIPVTNASTLEIFKNILYRSSDSFFFDFILVHLTDHTRSLAVNTSGFTGFDQYKSFLKSPTPRMNLLDKLSSKLPVGKHLFASYKIFKPNDITPALLRCFVQRTATETDRIRADFLSIPSLAPLDPEILDCSNNYDPTTFKVTPMNVSDSYMRSYRAHYTNLQTQLAQLESGLDLCAHLQDSKPIASSPLISPHLTKMKQMYLSIFQLFQREEKTLFQFERAFTVARMCSNDIIGVTDMRKQFSELAFIGRDRSIERHELNNLIKIAYKSMQLISNLEKAFELSSSSVCPTLEPLCQEIMRKVKKECEAHMFAYYRIENVRDALEELKVDIEDCFVKGLASDEYYDRILSRFTDLLQSNGMAFMEDFKSYHIRSLPSKNNSKDDIITRKIIRVMTEFVSKQFFVVFKEIIDRERNMLNLKKTDLLTKSHLQ